MVEFQKKTEYLLMNKDCCVLSFLCIRNEYDEPTFQELQWYVDYRPIGYKTRLNNVRALIQPVDKNDVKQFVKELKRVS